MATYTTTDFLSSVRVRGNIPTTTNDSNVNSTANLLVMATEELHIKLLPLLMSVREEFYVAPPKDYAITANQASYAVPTRASGQVLRDIQVIEGSSIWSLPRVDPEQIVTTSTGTIQGYYLEHDSVVLYPTPAATSGTLRMRYFIRPGRLAATSACAQIATIDAGTNSVTVSAIPTSWSTGIVLDFVKASAPFKYLEIDQTTTSVSSTTIVFAALPTGLAVGDWLAPAEYSPIPQVPYEFLPVLAQMTVVKVLESNGDEAGMIRAVKDLQMIQQSAIAMVTPRVQGENKKVIARRWR